MMSFEQIEKLKQEKLLDIIRQVIANPHKASEAAREIAMDWSPILYVDAKGECSFMYGSGTKR